MTDVLLVFGFIVAVWVLLAAAVCVLCVFASRPRRYPFS